MQKTKALHISPLSINIKPRKKFKIPKKISKSNRNILDNIDDNLKTLDLYINELQPELSLPVLMKKYLQMNGKIIGFNIDSDFNDCLDGLMMVNIPDIPLRMLDNMAKELEESSVRERFKTICFPN
jgi:putative hemolysin